MRATAPNPTNAPMKETIDYGTGLDRPAGSPHMTNAPPQVPHRYTYGSGARPLDGYTIKRAIGRGGFGEVYYATSDSGKEVALKLITRHVEVERRGVAQCMNLKCPNLLSIYDIRTNDAGETFVVMEYVTGPNLAQIIERFPDGMPLNEILVWLKGLADGVDYLHDHGIVHRDLKPANLFMEEGVVKIGDYGLSKIISSQQGSEHSESIGTCHYMAPEISSGKYHKPIDIYAIGIILHEMLTGHVPFEGESVAEVLAKHLFNRPDLSRLAEPYQTIVAEALKKEPANRPKRAHDLLPPDESPKLRDVRFIGEATKGKVPPPDEPKTEPRGLRRFWAFKTENPPPLDAKKDDDILRIGEEEPVFYIGPETRPPRTQAAFQPVIPPFRAARNPARKSPGPRPQAMKAAFIRPTPPPPPSPVPLPSKRVRVGELAGSMFATTLVALLIAAIMQVDTVRRFESSVFLFGLTLVGTWAALLSSKPMEGANLDTTTRRLLNAFLGAGLGLFGAWLAQWLKLGFTPASPTTLSSELGRALGLGAPYFAANFAAAFGVGYFLNGWWKLTDRDRQSRFRLMPVIASGLLAVVVSPLWPYREAWVLAVLPAVAIATQVVSPWNRQAAAYARYVKGTSRVHSA